MKKKARPVALSALDIQTDDRNWNALHNEALPCSHCESGLPAATPDWPGVDDPWESEEDMYFARMVCVRCAILPIFEAAEKSMMEDRALLEVSLLSTWGKTPPILQWEPYDTFFSEMSGLRFLDLLPLWKSSVEAKSAHAEEVRQEGIKQKRLEALSKARQTRRSKKSDMDKVVSIVEKSLAKKSQGRKKKVAAEPTPEDDDDLVFII